MRVRGGELLEAPLTVRNLGAEQVLMVAVKWLAFHVFVGSISQGHGGARQDILDPSVKAGLFLLCRMESAFDGLQNGAHAQPIGFSVSIGRACLEILIARAGLKVVVRASPQKKLKHRRMSGPKPRSSAQYA